MSTLQRFAEYYDVALDVRFLPVHDYVEGVLNKKPTNMAPPASGASAMPALLQMQDISVPQEPLALSKFIRTRSSKHQETTDLSELMEVHGE